VSAAVRFPNITGRLGLGVGMDLPWGQEVGFTIGDHGDTISERMRRFFAAHRDVFRYLFLAFQPRRRNHLRAADYYQAYDALFAASDIPVRALHHTILNLGATGGYDRAPIYSFTNDLVRRYRFGWVSEDLGVWSLAGKALPYPLPPFLTTDGLAACIRNVAEAQAALAAPLVIEFPGFTEGQSFCVGDLDAFDFFREVAQATSTPVVLDVGHVLSYQWIRGRNGRRMFDGIERLPLDHCFELHLSGCVIHRGRFRDLHHGVLLDEQLDMLDVLLERCPQLAAVTFEDPRYTADGALVARARPNFERLRKAVARWAA
jgi:uncharacterized protein (UPF0276 family)